MMIMIIIMIIMTDDLGNVYLSQEMPVQYITWATIVSIHIRCNFFFFNKHNFSLKYYEMKALLNK